MNIDLTEKEYNIILNALHVYKEHVLDLMDDQLFQIEFTKNQCENNRAYIVDINNLKARLVRGGQGGQGGQG